MANCRKCGDGLVADDNWWPSYAKHNDRICIDCKMAYNRKWEAEHREERRAYKRPLVTCCECGEEKPNHAHGLCNSCYMAQWREENIDHVLEYSRQYRAEHPDECLEAQRRWCLENPDYYREYSRQWRQENPERKREHDRRRRARLASVVVQEVDERAVFEFCGNVCIYCGSTDDLTLDHIVPLNSGGPHREDNLVVACRSCNASKNDRPLMEWLQTKPRALAWVL